MARHHHILHQFLYLYASEIYVEKPNCAALPSGSTPPPPLVRGRPRYFRAVLPVRTRGHCFGVVAVLVRPEGGHPAATRLQVFAVPNVSANDDHPEYVYLSDGGLVEVLICVVCPELGPLCCVGPLWCASPAGLLWKWKGGGIAPLSTDFGDGWPPSPLIPDPPPPNPHGRPTCV